MRRPGQQRDDHAGHRQHGGIGTPKRRVTCNSRMATNSSISKVSKNAMMCSGSGLRTVTFQTAVHLDSNFMNDARGAGRVGVMHSNNRGDRMLNSSRAVKVLVAVVIAGALVA